MIVQFNVSIYKLNIPAWHQAPPVRLNLVDIGSMIQFGLVVCLHFGIGLPTVVDVAYGLNLLLVEHHECLLRLVGLDGAVVLVPCAQIHKEHLVLTVAQLPAIAYATLLVLIQNPKGYARICGIEHLTRQDEDSLHLIVTYQLLAYGQCVFIF